MLNLALLVAAVASAGPAGVEVRFDPERSEIRFTLGATLHTVRGTAALEEGRVRYEPSSGDLSGRIVVDARSADTGNERRDRDMHQDVLESERFPRIALSPERVRGAWDGTGEGTLTLVGTLALHGGEHPIEVPLSVSREEDTVTVEGEFEVPYVEWGMEDPSFFLLRVDEHVTVRIRLVGTVVAGEAASPPGARASPLGEPVEQVAVDLVGRADHRRGRRDGVLGADLLDDLPLEADRADLDAVGAPRGVAGGVHVGDVVRRHVQLAVRVLDPVRGDREQAGQAHGTQSRPRSRLPATG
jgi:polyisoprenoid-binding protein YceI